VDEQEIIELLRSRDERGVQEMLRHFGPLMRYVIAPILADTRDREECLSECAMKVWDKIGSFDSARGSWRAWLTAIARNAALNRARGLRTDGELSEASASTSPSPEEELVRRERSAALKDAVARLSGAERNIFYRKYYYMQPTAQIAAELGMTERAVEGKLYRIRKRLREALGGEGHEYP
jgi:RNA polymerase sigma factor (sigma-70 family)